MSCIFHQIGRGPTMLPVHSISEVDGSMLKYWICFQSCLAAFVRHTTRSFKHSVMCIEYENVRNKILKLWRLIDLWVKKDLYWLLSGWYDYLVFIWNSHIMTKIGWNAIFLMLSDCLTRGNLVNLSLCTYFKTTQMVRGGGAMLI